MATDTVPQAKTHLSRLLAAQAVLEERAMVTNDRHIAGFDPRTV